MIAIAGSSVEDPEELGQGKVYTTVTSISTQNPYGIAVEHNIFVNSGVQINSSTC